MFDGAPFSNSKAFSATSQRTFHGHQVMIYVQVLCTPLWATTSGRAELLPAQLAIRVDYRYIELHFASNYRTQGTKRTLRRTVERTVGIKTHGGRTVGCTVGIKTHGGRTVGKTHTAKTHGRGKNSRPKTQGRKGRKNRFIAFSCCYSYYCDPQSGMSRPRSRAAKFCPSCNSRARPI